MPPEGSPPPDSTDWLAVWRAEEARSFSGWDFSHLRGRMIEDEPPWSYMDRAAAFLREASSALDIDTGGGERLLRLRDAWPPQLAATEAYPPNVAIARAALERFGVSVVDTSGNRAALPLPDGAFDLVVDRHGALPAEEIARVLIPGGRFLTEQVDRLMLHDLVAAFGLAVPTSSDCPAAVASLEHAGLIVEEAHTWQGRMRFTDVAAIVFYLHAIPWVVPDFSVDGHAEHLLALQSRLDDGSELAFTTALSLIVASKPAEPGSPYDRKS